MFSQIFGTYINVKAVSNKLYNTYFDLLASRTYAVGGNLCASVVVKVEPQNSTHSILSSLEISSARAEIRLSSPISTLIK